MTQFFIGINGGGTHTDFILTDRQLTVLARHETGPTNYQNIGVEAAGAAIEEGITHVLRSAGIQATQLAAIGAGMSGTDRPEDRVIFSQLFDQVCPGVRLILDNDAVAALVAGAGRRFGVVTISGTGSIAVGFNEAGEPARSGGWGYLVEGGSGYAIARDVLFAVFSAYDGSHPPTLLTERVMTRLHLESPTDLTDWLYAPDRKVEHIARLAAEAVGAADEDKIAAGIIAHAADDLAILAITVARKLDLKQFPLVMSGSLFKYSALLRTRFVSMVQTAVPGAQPIDGDHDPVLGAAIMALDGVSNANSPIAQQG